MLQAIFSVALHLTGTFVAAEIPCPVGPRNCGHSVSPARASNGERARAKKAARSFMREREREDVKRCCHLSKLAARRTLGPPLGEYMRSTPCACRTFSCSA